MKREINDGYMYLVMTHMEYSHIKTVLTLAMDEVDDATKHELIYVYDALTHAYCNFLKFADLEGGEEDEDEQ
jgi:hypothetical protein